MVYKKQNKSFENNIMKPKHCYDRNNYSDKITKTANFKYMQMCDYSVAFNLIFKTCYVLKLQFLY